MTFSLNTLLSLVLESIRNPREAAATILNFAPSRDVLLQLLALVVVLSVLFGQVGVVLLGGGLSDGALTGPIVLSPLTAAFVQFGLLVMLVISIHSIGRAFGGTGSFEETLLLVTWLQFILLCLQIIQLAALVLVPPLGGLIGLLSVGLFLWLLVNFVAVIHNFRSLGLVFAGVLISAFAIIFALSLILSMLGLAVPGST
ncbi:MAG: Yip1 family protein [Dinoroseobacter sp.]|nr:Yip1 family protein [Dinoroseobacter sp.]MDJ0993844.1 Yip1 family protein [Dinoroseobacter sp.]